MNEAAEEALEKHVVDVKIFRNYAVNEHGREDCCRFTEFYNFVLKPGLKRDMIAS